MKKTSILYLAIFLFIGCAPKKEITKVAEVPKAEEVIEVMEEEVAIVPKNYSVTKGKIHWTGAKIAYDHKGTIDIKAGTLSANGFEILSGDFVIDMNSITNTDLSAEKKPKLEGHLKSADFFDVAKFPNASFSITSVKEMETETANYSITGNLTMLGISKEVTFPTLVVVKDDGSLIALTDKFTIDRTDWGIKYGTTLAGTPEDAAISEVVKLQIEFVAN